MKHVPSARTASRSLAHIFALPLLLLAASLAGLVIGLAGEGWHDVAASALLSLPLLAAAVAWHRRG
ncbi:hypothetical protein [Erythrobacter sp. WG]|uniref:hypothetical protein n=1 Tax=Erythrobacter sp. WG TaxID=2985510 RepID=UPI00226DB8CA|nr:hypothetical protein [Erythrobacter sp. WG]MCX9146548.1 hypothetical protein [Erythrobacter sp. WG]